MIRLTRDGVITALLVVAALFVGSLVAERMPDPAAVLDRPFERHAGIGAPVPMRTGTLTVTGIRSGAQVSSYLDIAATQGVWLVADVEWTPTTEAFPLNAHAARVVAADGRRYSGTSEIATGCTRTQAGVTFVCALAFEMAPTALAGAALHVAASSSVDDADDVAVIDLGLDAAGAAALASAAGRVVLAEPHVKEP